MSAAGIFFETDGELGVGNAVAFAVDLEGPNGKMQLKCNGSIVRVVKRDGKVGVAVRIDQSVLQTL